ncbi:hypothetical protein EDB85DRAFT_678770 [Lactarius pseudohatsudake]|nr:hypothetical protein EDB85DRAFT_678770 [Lactarius pseudohatsudake]
MAAFLNSSPSASQTAGRRYANLFFCVAKNCSRTPSLDSAQIAESQGDLRVEVTILRARNVPRIKKRFGLKRQFFVTVTDGETEKKTGSVQIDGRTAQWNEMLGAFSTRRSSRLILRLYAMRSAHSDILIGMCEISIPLSSQLENNVTVDLSHGGGDAGESTQPVTLYLTIIVSGNMASPVSPTDPPRIPTNGDDLDSSAEEGTTSSIVSDPGGPIQSTFLGPLSPLSDPLPVETGAPMPDGQVEMLPTERATLRVNEAENQVNGWNGAISRIKWVMDTVGPVAELHPYAKMAYGLVSAIPKTLLENRQYQRDDDVRSLLEVVRDSFDFALREDTLKSTEHNSRQAMILTLMLQHICNCCDFIQSYTKDTGFCTLS